MKKFFPMILTGSFLIAGMLWWLGRPEVSLDSSPSRSLAGSNNPQDSESATPLSAGNASDTGDSAGHTPSVDQQISRQRIAGLTIDEMTSLISASGPDGRVSEHSRFLWRATELLRVDPAACAALVPIYQDAAAPSGRRTLIADLLAQAGAPHAQKTLVEVLESPTTERDPARVELWQRLSFVEEPTPETLQAATQRLQGTGGEDRLAMVHTLGALAAHAKEAGDLRSAGEIHRMLEQSYSNAEAGAEKISAIIGLGNARDPADIGKFVTHLSSESTEERGAAIRAIARQASNPEARRELASVAESSEHEPEIRDAAIRGLSKGSLSEPEYQTLANAATSSDPAGSTVAEIGKTLTRKFDSENSPGWRTAVESLVKNSTGEVANQANGLLYLDQMR